MGVTLEKYPFSGFIDNILEQLSYINDQNILQITHQYGVWLNQLKAELDKELSVQEIKHIKSSFYSNINS